MEVVSVRSSNISTRGIEIESWADRQPRCELLELGHLHHLLVIYLSNLNLSGHDNIYWLNSLLNRARDHMKVWQAGDNDHDQTWKRIMFLEIMFLFLLASITCISWITNVFNIWFENGYRAQFTFMNILEMYSDVCSTIPLLGLIKTLLAFFWDSLHHESYWVHIRKRKTSNKYIDSSAAGLLSFITSLQISNTTTLLQTFLRALSIDRAQYWHFANGEYLKLIPSFNFSGLFLSPHQLFCLHHHGTWSTGALLCSSFLLVLSLVLKVPFCALLLVLLQQVFIGTHRSRRL